MEVRVLSTAPNLPKEILSIKNRGEGLRSSCHPSGAQLCEEIAVHVLKQWQENFVTVFSAASAEVAKMREVVAPA